MRQTCMIILRDGPWVSPQATPATRPCAASPPWAMCSPDPGDHPLPGEEDGHRLYLCAEHWDRWHAPRPAPERDPLDNLEDLL